VVIVVPDEVEVRPIHLDLRRFHDDRTHDELAALAEKGPDVDVLRQRVQFMVQRLMEIDVEGRYGAGYDEKAHGARRNSRNGYRQRLWETVVSEILCAEVGLKNLSAVHS
jgi:putative transposase